MSDWSNFPCLSGVLHCRIVSLNRQDTSEFWSCGVCSSCKGIVTLENSSFWMGAVPIFATEIKVTNWRAHCEFLPPAFTLQSSSWALLANGVANPILKASRPFTLYFPANIWEIIIWSSWQSFIFFSCWFISRSSKSNQSKKKGPRTPSPPPPVQEETPLGKKHKEKHKGKERSEEKTREVKERGRDFERHKEKKEKQR